MELLMYEKRLEDEERLSNQMQNVNHQNYGNGHAIIGQQLTSTRISSEDIYQIPIILLQSDNPKLASNTADSTTFVQGGNQIISIPNQLLSIPSEVEINQNSEQESSAQITESFTVEEITSEPTTESNQKEDNEKENTIGDRMVIELASTNANGPKSDETFEQIANSSTQHLEVIGLTSDQAEATNALRGKQNKSLDVNKITATGNLKEKQVLSKGDAHTTNQTIISTSRIESPSTQQSLESNLNPEQPSPNIAEESNTLQHSMTIMPGNANEVVSADNDLELTSSDRIVVPGAKDGDQRQDIATEAEDMPQYIETIDLISDGEEAENQNLNNVTGQSQPTILRQKRKSDKSKESFLTQSEIFDQLMFDFNSIQDNEKLNTVNSESIMDSTSTSADCAMETDNELSEMPHLYYSTDSEEVVSSDDDEQYDVYMTNQTTIPSFQNELTNAQKIMEIDLNTGQSLSNIAEDLVVPQHSMIITPNSTSGAAIADNDFELYGQIQPGMASDSNIQINPLKTSSDSTVQTTMRFKCNFCKYATNKNSNFIEHKRTHTGERPFECYYCGKQFRRKSNLNRHFKSKIHKYLFEFQCSKCLGKS